MLKKMKDIINDPKNLKIVPRSIHEEVVYRSYYSLPQLMKMYFRNLPWCCNHWLWTRARARGEERGRIAPAGRNRSGPTGEKGESCITRGTEEQRGQTL